MKLTYYIRKFIGSLFDSPIIPKEKTVGYSFVRSERANSMLWEHAKIYPPFFLHNIELGSYSYIAKNSNISNCKIGRFCSIGPNFCCGLGRHPTNGISTAPMFYSVQKQNGFTLCDNTQFVETKKTTIGNDVFIGANVTILDGVKIGDGAIIGAGAVVTSDIPAYAIAAGVPAKIKKFRFTKCQISALMRIKWWEWSEEELTDIKIFFYDIDSFIERYDVPHQSLPI